jgi:hypothetical protein
LVNNFFNIIQITILYRELKLLLNFLSDPNEI